MKEDSEHKHICTCGGRCVKLGVVIDDNNEEGVDFAIGWLQGLVKHGQGYLKAHGFKFCLRKVSLPIGVAVELPEFEHVEMVKSAEIVGDEEMDFIVIFSQFKVVDDSLTAQVAYFRKLKDAEVGGFKTVSECFSEDLDKGRSTFNARIFLLGRNILESKGKLPAFHSSL